MSRTKKKRTGGQPVIWLDGPRRSEKLADPESYESRKRKNLDKKKKVKSVFEKHQDENSQEGNGSEQRKTRLSDKIRKIKKEDS
ncbi:hypothetical protein [Aliamphritea ceti]|uniref:hypothetical protein n=1 Tax=Aliamphritea ceti TaxID=1524258 RepID=UPI0021C4A505|nr:hypothetical protein [Aliamphritea ceti]